MLGVCDGTEGEAVIARMHPWGGLIISSSLRTRKALGDWLPINTQPLHARS